MTGSVAVAGGEGGDSLPDTATVAPTPTLLDPWNQDALALSSGGGA